MFFQQQDVWLRAPREELQKIAQLAGFTKESFEACLKNEAVAKGILAVRDKATNEFGVQSIPTFFVNGEEIKGETKIEEFRKLIDPLL
jgi:protein-disulfide isomerase